MWYASPVPKIVFLWKSELYNFRQILEVGEVL
jgi:hypothetical protein